MSKGKKMTNRIIAVVLIVLVFVVILTIILLRNNNNGQFGNGDSTISEPHREAFSPEIEEEVKAYFNYDKELKKAYMLRSNEWFLSDSLSDFSQVVTEEIVYVVPWDEQGVTSDMAYSLYEANEIGEVEWSCSAYPPLDTVVPFGFSGLTYEIIENALEGIEYEDYVITYMPQRFDTVLIWVRCESEDVIITYPTRSDLLGLEVGGVYTLKEIQNFLTVAYNS